METKHTSVMNETLQINKGTKSIKGQNEDNGTPIGNRPVTGQGWRQNQKPK